MTDSLDHSRYQTDNKSHVSLIQHDCWASRGCANKRHNEHVLRAARRRRLQARIRSLIFWKPVR